MFNNFRWFPITHHFYKEGINRCNEPVDLYEKNECFGPKDRTCIECYVC